LGDMEKNPVVAAYDTDRGVSLSTLVRTRV
jgi:hypothetical protein